MSRPCRWPGCNAKVPANMWGCRAHWYRLPKPIRDAIWKAYRPGQEDDLRRVSQAWAEADEDARTFAALAERQARGHDCTAESEREAIQAVEREEEQRIRGTQRRLFA